MARDVWNIIAGIGAAEWKRQVTEARLTLAEQGALLNLLIEACAFPGCCVPGDDDILARWSGLDRAWKESALRREMGRWFRRLPDGRIEAIYLAQAKGEQEARRAKTRLAGIASARARRLKSGLRSSHGSTSVGTDVPTPVATDVATPVESSGADGGAPARNPKARQKVRRGVTAAGRGDRPAMPPRPGFRGNCSGNDASRAIAGACDQAAEEGQSAPPGATESARANTPHTPLYGEDLTDRGGEGCRGGEAGSVQHSLWPDLDAPGDTPPGDAPGIAQDGPGAARRPGKVSTPRELLESASGVVDDYQARVRPAYARTAQADRNVAYWLQNGHTAEELMTATRNYAGFCGQVAKPEEFRQKASNFFGRRDPSFKGWLNRGKADGQEPVVSGGRVRVGGRYAADVSVTVSVADGLRDPPADVPAVEGARHNRNPFVAEPHDR